jgi:hypothetical protein
MSLTTRFGLVAGTTALAIAGTAFGGAESDNDALSQIAELKQELAELKQQDSQAWLTEERASEIRGIVQDVLADADTRTSFQNSGAMAGWNKGFFLASPDGNFRLNVGGLMQTRFTLNNAKDTTPPASENLYGFDMGSTYLDFSGHVVDPSWQFHVRGNFSGPGSAGGGMSTLTFASVTKDFGDGFGVTAGQFRGPWLRETLVDDGYQLGMDRSIVDSYFTQGFDQGIQLNYASDAFRYNVFLGDGVLEGNQQGGVLANSQNSAWNANNTKYSLAGRFEYKISGDWGIFDDFTSFKGEEGGMMVGLAGVYETGNRNAGALDNNSAYGFTGDFSWEMGGANLFASFIWIGNNIDGSDNPWAFNIQGGYFVSDDIEIFGRYDWLDEDVDPATEQSRYNGITVGANYFMTANVKATVEWGMNLKSFGTDNLSQGFRADATPNSTDQWALRAQLQLMF